MIYTFHRNDPWSDIILSLISCVFIDNTAVVRLRNRVGLPSVPEIGSGGAFRGGLRCIRSNFTGNSAELHAGVVLVTNIEIYPNFYSERCIILFSNNSAKGGIGGVYHSRFRLTTAHILDSSFQNNTALHCGVLFAATFSTGYVNNITIESSLFTCIQQRNWQLRRGRSSLHQL
jgi:hypothetical protein